ncbi:hypothetical protein FI667_g3451, partial [Globisporangium splendens]
MDTTPPLQHNSKDTCQDAIQNASEATPTTQKRGEQHNAQWNPMHAFGDNGTEAYLRDFGRRRIEAHIVLLWLLFTPIIVFHTDKLLGQWLNDEEEVTDERYASEGEYEVQPLGGRSDRAIKSAVSILLSHISAFRSPGNNAPVISSCRAESQAYMRDLKAAHDKTKQELRFEKDKNAILVSKALELEKEKNALLAAAQVVAPPPEAIPSHQAKWDKEQVQKIQATLKMTIEELQDELSRKQEELESYKERFQRERSRTKQLEGEIRSRETGERDAERVRKQLEADLREAEQEITREQESAHRVHERAQEDRMIRTSLEEQLETLNEVNAALEQRCNALVRRVELSACVMQDCEDLKMQLRDAEIDNETLVRTIHDLKEQQFLREKELKGEIENAKDETHQVELYVKGLEADLTSLRAQNSLFSEWMLVRNENALIAKKDLRDNGGNAASPHPSSPYSPHCATGSNSHRNNPMEPSTARNCHEATSYSPQVHPCNHQYLSLIRPAAEHTSSPEPSRKEKDLSHLRTDSPQRTRASAPTSNVKGAAILARKMSTASVSSSYSSSSVSTTTSATNTDHERLRMLVSRNRELQQRLQQETLTTQNLEQEITSITTSYTHPHQRR